METMKMPLKLQAAATICLLVASCFATIQNTALLSAYTRHAVQASQDAHLLFFSGTAATATVAGKEIMSEHLIRIGKHLQLLNQNMDNLEREILDHPNRFINGDWSKQYAVLQKKLNAMGFKGTLVSPSPQARAVILAHIRSVGLKQHIHMHGSMIEHKGGNLVAPFAHVWEPIELTNASFSLVPVFLAGCDWWTGVGGDLMAVGAIATLFGPEAEPVAFALAATGGVAWLFGEYAPRQWC